MHWILIDEKGSALKEGHPGPANKNAAPRVGTRGPQQRTEKTWYLCVSSSSPQYVLIYLGDLCLHPPHNHFQGPNMALGSNKAPLSFLAPNWRFYPAY